MSKIPIMSPDQTQRTLVRLAYEVIERNRGAGNLELVGIRKRGAALANVLASEIGRIEGRSFDVHELDVTPYRDDRDANSSSEDRSSITSDFTDRDVILIDDVLFTGRTARAALDAIVRFGRPRTIQLVVLVDRGNREYPIQPDYVGRLIHAKYKERVIVDIEQGVTVSVVE